MTSRGHAEQAEQPQLFRTEKHRIGLLAAMVIVAAIAFYLTYVDAGSVTLSGAIALLAVVFAFALYLIVFAPRDNARFWSELGLALATGLVLALAAWMLNDALANASKNRAVEKREAEVKLAVNRDGQTSFRAEDLSGLTLIGMRLVGEGGTPFDLSHAKLSSADLTDVDLQNAVLDHADLRDATLVRTNLAGASLRNADLRGATLGSTNLAGAVLRGAKGLDDADELAMELSGQTVCWNGANGRQDGRDLRALWNETRYSCTAGSEDGPSPPTLAFLVRPHPPVDTLVGRIDAIDPGGKPLRFDVDGDAELPLAVNDDGEIRVSGDLVPGVNHQFCVWVSHEGADEPTTTGAACAGDADGGRAPVLVTVEVEDDPAPPVAAPVLLVDVAAQRGARVGKVLFGDPSRSQQEGSPTFKIVAGDTDRLFEFDPVEKDLLRLRRSIEAGRAYTLTVQVTQGQHSTTIPVRIEARSFNRAPSFAAEPYEVRPDLGRGALIGRLDAHDPDGDTLAFEVVGDPGPFDVSVSGRVTVGGALEPGTDYQFEVRVADDGVPSLDVTGNVVVRTKEEGILTFAPVIAHPDLYLVRPDDRLVVDDPADGVLGNDESPAGVEMKAAPGDREPHADFFNLETDGTFSYHHRSGLVDGFDYHALGDTGAGSPATDVRITVVPGRRELAVAEGAVAGDELGRVLARGTFTPGTLIFRQVGGNLDLFDVDEEAGAVNLEVDYATLVASGPWHYLTVEVQVVDAPPEVADQPSRLLAVEVAVGVEYVTGAPESVEALAEYATEAFAAAGVDCGEPGAYVAALRAGLDPAVAATGQLRRGTAVVFPECPLPSSTQPAVPG